MRMKLKVLYFINMLDEMRRNTEKNNPLHAFTGSDNKQVLCNGDKA